MTAAVWTVPKDWATGEAVTATKLNAHLRDNLKHLYQRPRGAITIKNGVNIVLSNTSWGVVDDAQFTIQFETTGADLLVDILIPLANSAVCVIGFDVIIDDVNYMSSGSATPITNGVWSTSVITSGLVLFSGTFMYQGLAAGVHTFKLRHKRAAAGNTTLLLASNVVQFTVREG